MYSIFIIEKNSGRVVFSKQFGKIVIDENLLSGFLTALYGFASGELDQTGIENIACLFLYRMMIIKTSLHHRWQIVTHTITVALQ